MLRASQVFMRGLCTTLAAVVFAGGLVPACLAPPLAAQSAEVKPDPEAGDMVVLREVPTRAGQKEGTGDAFVVNMAPNAAFTDALDLGIAELDDADAALITSTALNGFNQLGLIDASSATTDALIAGTLRDNGLSLLGNPAGSAGVSVVRGSVDAALSATTAATASALGNISGALGNLNGGGQ